MTMAERQQLSNSLNATLTNTPAEQIVPVSGNSRMGTMSKAALKHLEASNPALAMSEAHMDHKVVTMKLACPKSSAKTPTKPGAKKNTEEFKAERTTRSKTIKKLANPAEAS